MLNVSDIAAKVLTQPDDDGDVNIAVKATIVNDDESEAVDGLVAIQGVDSDGFEVENIYLRYSLAPGEAKVISDRTDMNVEEFSRIARWQFKC
jgi:hypothetical protein